MVYPNKHSNVETALLDRLPLWPHTYMCSTGLDMQQRSVLHHSKVLLPYSYLAQNCEINNCFSGLIMIEKDSSILILIIGFIEPSRLSLTQCLLQLR